MAFKDRVVEFPGRVALTPAKDSNGNIIADTYDIKRAEGEVTEEGTLLNADSLNSEILDLIEGKIGNLLNANGKVSLRKYVQAGKGTLKTKGNAKKVVKLSVTFPQAFSSVPYVAVSPVSSVPHLVSVSITDVTTTGFTVCMYRNNGTADTSIRWIAVRT